MDWNREDEVVGGGGWGAEVEEAEIGVAAYGGEDGGGVRGPCGGVGAGVGGNGEEGLRAIGVPLSVVVRKGCRLEGGKISYISYHFNCSIP